MRIRSVLLLVTVSASLAFSQTSQNASHMRPSGKGWGVDDPNGPAVVQPYSVVTGNGIQYHGGPVMKSGVKAYFIWYGNWTNGPKASDSAATQILFEKLFASGGIGGSSYMKINTTYGDNSGNATSSIVLAGSTTDNYSQGKLLSDSKVKAIVSKAITSGKLPKSSSALYFVFTSSDVSESSGFCTKYCGWHTAGSISGSTIKYSFVGNADRCPSACSAQSKSPNGDRGGDAMASVAAHEAEETITDPLLNAWYDSKGNENADKCAWKFGPVKQASNGSYYNQTFNSLHFLIQMNWENRRGGGCDQKLGGTFYTK